VILPVLFVGAVGHPTLVSLGEKPSVIQEQADLARDLEIAKSLVTARDVALRSAFMEFDAVAEYPPPDPPGLYYRERGWIGWCGERLGIEVDVATNLGPSGVGRGEWDGETFRGVAGLEEVFPTLTLRSVPSLPFSAYDPLQFGFRFQNSSLLELLSDGPQRRARALSREHVDGKDCLKILIEAPSGRQVNEWTPVCVLWLDDRESLLIVRAAKIGTRRASMEGVWRAEIDSETFEVIRTWEVLQAERVAGSFWFPVQCRYASKLSGNVLVTIPKASILVNQDEVIDGLIRLDRDRWYLVHDQRPGAPEIQYVQGPAGRASAETASFVRELTLESRWRGFAVPTVLETDIPFSESSCGPSALLLVAWGLGSRPSLEELLGKPGAGSAPPAQSSLAGLATAASALGLHARAVRIDGLRWLKEFSAQPEHWAIVHLSGQDPRGAAEHFAVAVFKDDGVDLISPPLPRETISVQRFETEWTGHALLVSKADIDLRILGELAPMSGTSPTTQRPWKRVGAILGILVGCGVACILWQRYRRRMNSGARVSRAHEREVGMILLLAVLCGGCGRGDGSAAPTGPGGDLEGSARLRVRGPARVDVGVVDLGTRMQADFVVQNASVERVRIQAAPSCSCDEVRVSRTDLGPGERCVVTLSSVAFSAGRAGVSATVNAVGPHGPSSLVLGIDAEVRDTEVTWLEIEPSRRDLGSVKAGSAFEVGSEVRICRRGPAASHGPELSRSALTLEGCTVEVTGEWQERRNDGTEVLVRTLRIRGTTADHTGGFERRLLIACEPPWGNLKGVFVLQARVQGCVEFDPEVVFRGSLAGTESVEATVNVILRDSALDPQQLSPRTSATWLKAEWACAPAADRNGVLVLRGIPPGGPSHFDESVNLAGCGAGAPLLRVVGTRTQ